MDYSRLALFIWNIDKTLLFFCLILSVAIFSTVLLQEKLLVKRVLLLIRVRKDLRALVTKEETAMKRVCPVIMEKTSPEDFLELTRSKSTFMPPEFAEDLRKCFAASGKIENLEKTATARFVPKWRKIQALVALGHTEDAKGFNILKNALNDKDADISYYAMLSLAHLTTNAAAHVLLDHCAQKPGDGRKVASCLEKFPAAIIEELIRATYADSDSVRFWAVRVMTKFKDKKCLERIMALTKDPNPEIRASSCECLGELRAPEAKAALLERLNDTLWFVRLHAVRAICKVCGHETIDYLVPLKKDPHWIIRDAVNKCLSEKRGPELT